MKKRIGSKLYDTETAVCILPAYNLYRTQRKKTFFLFDGADITPVSYEDAEKMIMTFGSAEDQKSLYHVPTKKGNCMIGVDPAAADRLSAYCRKNNVTQKSVLESFINSLPLE